MWMSLWAGGCHVKCRTDSPKCRFWEAKNKIHHNSLTAFSAIQGLGAVIQALCAVLNMS